MYIGLETAKITSTLPAGTSKKLFIPAPPRNGLGSNLPIGESAQSSRTQVSCQPEEASCYVVSGYISGDCSWYLGFWEAVRPATKCSPKLDTIPWTYTRCLLGS